MLNLMYEEMQIEAISKDSTVTLPSARKTMAAANSKSPSNPQNPPKEAAAKNRNGGSSAMILSPGFRSAAAMAGWDEEALLATLVVEDTPVRESRQQKQQKRLKSPASTTSTRKRRSRRQPRVPIPPVVLSLDDEEDGRDKIDKEVETVVVDKPSDRKEDLVDKASSKGVPCIDRLREELSCAICLEICFEPSTTPCGHSFCIKCLKFAATKCGKRCPKCRQLISNGRSCTINTVLWNTIQLLFPEEVEARKSNVAVTSPCSANRSEGAVTSPNTATRRRSSQHTNSTTSIVGRINNRNSIRRVATQPSQVRESSSRSLRPRVGLNQSEDAALALRLQREEFLVAFRGTRELRPQSFYSAHAYLRSMASRGV